MSTSFSAFTLAFIFLTLYPLLLTGLPILSLFLKSSTICLWKIHLWICNFKIWSNKLSQVWNTKSIKPLLINSWQLSWKIKSSRVGPVEPASSKPPFPVSLSAPQNCILYSIHYRLLNIYHVLSDLPKSAHSITSIPLPKTLLPLNKVQLTFKCPFSAGFLYPRLPQRLQRALLTET